MYYKMFVQNKLNALMPANNHCGYNKNKSLCKVYYIILSA